MDCHGTCEEYAKALIVGVLLKSEEARQRRADNDATAVEKKRMTRVKHVMDERRRQHKRGS